MKNLQPHFVRVIVVRHNLVLFIHFLHNRRYFSHEHTGKRDIVVILVQEVFIVNSQVFKLVVVVIVLIPIKQRSILGKLTYFLSLSYILKDFFSINNSFILRFIFHYSTNTHNLN